MRPKFKPFPDIRHADLGDIRAIEEMARLFHEESDVARHEFRPEGVRTMAARYAASDDHLCLVDRHYKGFFLGAMCKYVFADARFAREEYWYVRPEFRGSGRVGMRFFLTFLDWAAEKGADDIFVGTSTGINVKKTHKLMNRLKFHHVGGFYRRQLDV